MLGIHIPLMVVVSMGVLPIMSTGMRIIRAEGALMVAVYMAYNVILFQTTSPATPPDLKEQDMPAQIQPKDSDPAQNDQPAITATASAVIDSASQTQILPANEEPAAVNKPAIETAENGNTSVNNASGSTEPASTTTTTGK
ncbi:MAG: hypothetical protein A2W80_08785 [Candidatus Riflebacteria bacterium GWC2_50_8]|nr:MAG: hypothetical protein A2W80_08785 [Candidatus Riflebacteria bacterium GWC2_50_8]